MVVVFDGVRGGYWHWMGDFLDWEVAHDFWIVGYCLDGVFRAGMV